MEEGAEIGESIGRENMSGKGMRKADEFEFCRLHTDFGIIT